jgi:hypothetical protein
MDITKKASGRECHWPGKAPSYSGKVPTTVQVARLLPVAAGLGRPLKPVNLLLLDVCGYTQVYEHPLQDK